MNWHAICWDGLVHREYVVLSISMQMDKDLDLLSHLCSLSYHIAVRH